MKKIFSANTLKLFAIIAMTLDHIAWAVFPGYPTEPLPLILHAVGRITCPIMCYFVAEGYHYTKDIRKYTARLFAFALLSHIPYVFTSVGYIDPKSFIPFYYGNILNQTSVMWSLAWGLVMLRVVNSPKYSPTTQTLLILGICLTSFPSDWSCIASLCILAFGTNRGKLKEQMRWMLFYVAIYATVYFFTIDKVYGLLQMGVALAIPLLKCYNGQRGGNPAWNKAMKWLFYWYYPIHLLIIGILK